jgi:hypothetical protein
MTSTNAVELMMTWVESMKELMNWVDPMHVVELMKWVEPMKVVELTVVLPTKVVELTKVVEPAKGDLMSMMMVVPRKQKRSSKSRRSLHGALQSPSDQHD